MKRWWVLDVHPIMAQGNEKFRLYLLIVVVIYLWLPYFQFIYCTLFSNKLHTLIFAIMVLNICNYLIYVIERTEPPCHCFGVH